MTEPHSLGVHVRELINGEMISCCDQQVAALIAIVLALCAVCAICWPFLSLKPEAH